MIFDFFISSFLLRYNFEFSHRKEEDCRWIWELCEKAQVWCRSGSPTILLQHPSPQHSWHEYAQVSDLYQTLSRIQVFSHFGDFATNLKTNDQSTKTGQTLVRIRVHLAVNTLFCAQVEQVPSVPDRSWLQSESDSLWSNGGSNRRHAAAV